MNGRDVIGFFVLVAGVGGSLGGLGAVLRGFPLGWLGLAVGLLCCLASYRMVKTVNPSEG